MARILTKLRIDEISSVDKGAGEGVKIVLMKRNGGDDPPPDDTPDDTPDLLSKLEQMVIVTATALNMTPEEALHYLLKSPHGIKLAEHLNNLSKGDHPVNTSESLLTEILKRLDNLEAGGNLVAASRKAVEVGLTESEGATITKALKGDSEAMDRLLGFIKEQGVFKDGDPRTSSPALDEINVLAANLQKADPALSKAQAFSKVYENPDNRHLVQRERNENRPSAA